MNINSIRNKFEFVPTKVESNTDVLMVSETKIDNSLLQMSPVHHILYIATAMVVTSLCTLEKTFPLTCLPRTKEITLRVFLLN